MRIDRDFVDVSFEEYQPPPVTLQKTENQPETVNNPPVEDNPALSIDEIHASRTGLNSNLSSSLLINRADLTAEENRLPDELPPTSETSPVTPSVWLQDSRFDGLLVGADGQTYPPTTALRDIPPVLPNNGKTPTNETLIFVNGVANNLEEQFESMQRLANDSGARVIGVHNSTGRGTDGWQALGDKLGIGRNPAVRTLRDLIYREIKEGRNVQVLGHSQGAAITARALNDVKERLTKDDRMSQRSAENLLGRVKVETFGGIATQYPDGPQYVHYINMADGANIVGLGPAVLLGGRPGSGFFSKLFGGLSKLLPGLPGLPKPEIPYGGRDAVYHRFWSTESNNHNFGKVYSEHRVPFEQARRGDFRRR